MLCTALPLFYVLLLVYSFYILKSFVGFISYRNLFNLGILKLIATGGACT